MKAPLIALLLTALAFPALAAVLEPWDEVKFARARAAGRTILVAVDAKWSGTCRRQAQALHQVAREPKFSTSVALVLDYDWQRDDLGMLGVSRACTIVVFRGAHERGRATGLTSPGEIRVLWERALR